MSQGSSCLCLWQAGRYEGAHQESDPPLTRGVSFEPKVRQRKASRGRETWKGILMAVARHAVERRNQSRPRLRVITGGRGAASKKLKLKARAAPFAAVILIAACVFGLVLLNIYLAQSSFRLADLQSKVVTAEAEHRNMRLKVAVNESPEKVAAAAGALGLVVPEQQEYIEGRATDTRMAKAPPQEPEGVRAVLGRNP